LPYMAALTKIYYYNDREYFVLEVRS